MPTLVRSVGISIAVMMLLISWSPVISAQEMKPAVRPTPLKPEAVKSVDQARDRMVKEVYRGDIGKRAVFASPEIKKAGAKILGWRTRYDVTVNKDSWLFFVDDQPGANWEHEARYVLVDKTSGAVHAISTRTPPQDLRILHPMSPSATEQLRVMDLNAKTLRPGLVVKPVVVPKKDKYAVLVSGGWNADSNYARYWNDISFIYKALKEKYNYTDDEIIVLYANGTHSPNQDLDGNGTDDVDYAATKANLTKVMNDVSSHLAADGKFFFYSTNHGGQESGQDAILYLWGEWITDNEFADLSKKIKAKEAVYVMEQCFSGGMMDDLLKAQSYPCTSPSVCVMTAARYDEVSWGADTEGEYDEYVYYWTSAVYGKTPGGASVNADANGDGVVSMSEAHEYAKSHDSRNEHPQIGSCVATACGASLAAPSSLREDCVSFNPATTTVANINGSWKIVDGSHWMFDFGSKKAEADRSLAIIKHYKMNQSCFVGRPNPSFKYLLVSGAAPSGAMTGEDCVSFNPATATVANINGSWKIVDGSHWMFDFGSNRAEAEQSLQIIKKHGFTHSCFVGRPGPSFEYLRK
jgi:hypothetical protein